MSSIFSSFERNLAFSMAEEEARLIEEPKSALESKVEEAANLVQMTVLVQQIHQ